MKKFSFMVLVGIWMVYATSFAQLDSAAFRAASSTIIPHEKIKALEDFVAQYPTSKLITRACDGLFDLYVEQKNEGSSLATAARSLESVTPENRMNPYNRFAYALAQNGIGLDSALAWIVRAEDMATKLKSRSLAGFQDTRAYVLFKKGKPAEAEQLQRVAIQGNEDDPEFVNHLALYEKENGKLHDALTTTSKALFLGGDLDSKEVFLQWVATAEKDSAMQAELKKTIVMNTIHGYIDTLKGKYQVTGKSHAAILMADLGVDLATAKQWSEAAVKTLDRNSSLNDVLMFRQSLALVLAAQGKYSEAIVHLRTIEDLVDPYEGKFWNALGRAYEHLGDPRKAIDAYTSGLIPRNDKQLRSALEAVYTKHHGSLDGVEKLLDSARVANTNFNPGSYGKATTPSGKVILAELFTGAECGPCASSDMAFDALSDFFPRTALAILEYHVHIPGPDPMTTNGSWDRYNWNDGAGTPTVIIDGRESIIGGGPKTVAKNRFGVYRYAIQKFEAEKPRVNLSLHVSGQQDTISVEVKVTRLKPLEHTAAPMLHVALVERSVDYTGSNNISKHAFVVRRLFDGANGTALTMKRANETIVKKVSVNEVEKNIREYLDNPTRQASWSTRRPFTGWRSRPDTLNRSNLAIVVWVQDANTKSVLQAAYQQVVGAIGESQE